MTNKKILFVCLGNICRSPTAEAVFRKLCSAHIELKNSTIDSCGTTGFHQGQWSDPRSVSSALKRGYNLSLIRSRKISVEDFRIFDYILAMDYSNLESLKDLAIMHDFPTNNIHLFLDFANQSNIKEVPDPYYGGDNGFDHVIDLIEDASKGLIDELLGKELKVKNRENLQ
jgi:protein-tyrosine phosphatase